MLSESKQPPGRETSEPSARNHDRIESEDPDSDLIVSAFLDNEFTAVSLVARWARAVANRHAWTFESPEDVVQTVLLALVSNLRAGRFHGGDLRAYVRTIARNICVTNLRRLRRAGTRVPLNDEVGAPQAEMRAAAREESALLLRAGLAALGGPCREIVLQSFVYGVGRKELARRLGISEGATRARLFRCLEQARRAIGMTEGMGAPRPQGAGMRI